MTKPPEDPASPSDIYAAFTWDRLKIIAQVAYDRAWWVAEHAIPEDSRCGVGYRRWDLTRCDFAHMAHGEHKEWFSIEDGGARFIFKLLMMPVRFLRWDIEDPVPLKYAIPSTTERAGINYALGLDDENRYTDLVFRLLVEVDDRGRFPVRVLFVAVNIAGEIVYEWPIPVIKGAKAPASVVPITPVKEATPLPDIVVKTVRDDDAERERAEKERAEQERADREARGQGPGAKGA